MSTPGELSVRDTSPGTNYGETATSEDQATTPVTTTTTGEVVVVDAKLTNESVAKERYAPLGVSEAITIHPESDTKASPRDISSKPLSRDNVGVLLSMADILRDGKRPWSEYDQSKSNSGSTNIYIIAIIGVVPAAGALLWCVRKVLATKAKEAKVPSSKAGKQEEGIETYETNYQSRTDYGYLKQGNYAKNRAKNVEDDRRPTAPPQQTVTMPADDEVSREALQLQDVLGEGNFGRVLKATAYGLNGSNRPEPVAVKTLKEYASAEEKRDLLREMRVMRELGKHPNVVTFLGYCTKDEPLLLVMELVSKGKLLSFLRTHRSKGTYYNSPEGDGSLGPRDLTTFAFQVCQGMQYIASRGIIHRDLAARNVLVDEHNRCKVADFGLSRSIKDSHTDVYQQRSKGALPVRWLAPECLYLQVFTTKSDVWAFGILLWEIVTLGSTPYPGLCAQEVIKQVREGHIMPQPSHCRWELYRLMRACWSPDPKERPGFAQLCSDLDKLIKLNAGYIDLDNFPEHAYYNMYYGIDEKV